MSNKFQKVMRIILPSQVLREKQWVSSFFLNAFKVPVLLIFIYWEFVPFSYETHHEGSVVSSCSMLGYSKSLDLILDLRNVKHPLKYVGASPFNISHSSFNKETLPSNLLQSGHNQLFVGLGDMAKFF